jgi:thiol-disulfide isomerase/thioredoxin
MSNQGKNRARARAAEMRAAQQAEAAASRRRRTAITSIGVVAAVLAALVLAKVAGGPKAKSGKPTVAAPVAAVQALTHVPVSVLATVGAGSATAGPKAVSGQPVPEVDGKPTVLYIGAEWCPFCAAERWPLIAALSRFGTFGDLKETASTPSDSYPNTPTFSLHGVSYTSQYLSFVARELQSNQAKGGRYLTLDTLTRAENKVFKAQGRTFPYVNLAGRYLVPTQYDPKVLHGKTVVEVAAALSDPGSDIAKAIDGAANAFTAGLCKLTNNQPSSVCTAAPVAAIASQLR